ncbi:hypothetical protein MRX96_039269 [Rhipicephalus microplus]
MRIHPTNNTITVSTLDVNRAMAYLKITQLKVADQSCAMDVYAPALDNSTDGTTTDKSYQESSPPLGGRSASATGPVNSSRSRSRSRTRDHHNRIPAVLHTKSVAWQTDKQ